MAMVTMMAMATVTAMEVATAMTNYNSNDDRGQGGG